MTYEEILTSIKKRSFKPIYFLMGDEGWFIDQITDTIANDVLTVEEKGFNQTIMYGKDVNIDQVMMAARRYPMMTEYQVIIVKEAQNIEDIDKLEIYLQNPLKSTILVINYKYKTLDKRKKLTKLIDSTGVLFEAKRLYDNQIPSWINAQIRLAGKTIDPKACVLITENVGAELSKIAGELNKLVVASGPDVKHLLPEHVEKYIGISKDYNVFELQKAIQSKDFFKANQIAISFGRNAKENPFPVTVSSLFGFFVKLLMVHYLPDKSPVNIASALKINPYFANDYSAGIKNYSAMKVIQNISILREYDMKGKGFATANTDPGELIKDLVFKLMH